MISPENGPLIVGLGGGSGSTTIEEVALEKFNNIVGITPVSDDGGHSGKIIDVLGVNPPGDATRRIAVRIRNQKVRELFLHRWDGEHNLNGHRPMNELLAAAESQTGSHSAGIELIEEAFASWYVGRVVPASNDHVRLRALMSDGSILDGEHLLDELKTNDPYVKDIVFTKNNGHGTEATVPVAYPEALFYILKSRLNIAYPGSWWGSIMAITKIPDIASALSESKGKLALITNTTRSFDTQDWSASEFCRKFTETVDRKLDFAIINVPDHSFPDSYQKENSYPVEPDLEECQKYAEKVISGPFTTIEEIGGKPVVRHNGKRISQILSKILAC